MISRPTDELWERTRRLDAERLRPERPPPTPDCDPLRRLIRLLDGLLTNPGPPDPDVRSAEEPATDDRSTH